MSTLLVASYKKPVFDGENKLDEAVNILYSGSSSVLKMFQFNPKTTHIVTTFDETSMLIGDTIDVKLISIAQEICKSADKYCSKILFPIFNSSIWQALTLQEFSHDWEAFVECNRVFADNISKIYKENDISKLKVDLT